MKHYELLRDCADRLERDQTHIQLVWPRTGQGRFPFAGRGTEVSCATEQHTVYRVPISRILRALGNALV